MYENRRQTKHVLSGALAATLMLTAGGAPKSVSAEPMRPMVPEREREWEDIAPPVMTSDAVYDFAGSERSGFDPAADTIITTPYTSVVMALARKREMLAERPAIDRPLQERSDVHRDTSGVAKDAPQKKRSEGFEARRMPAGAPMSEIDARLHELYEYYANRDRGRGQSPSMERNDVRYDYGQDVGEAEGTASAGPRRETARPLPRHAERPRDTFYSKLELIDMGGLALRVLRGAKGELRAFGLALSPESYGLDAQTTFYFPTSSAKGLREMLDGAADRYAQTPVGERLGSFFRSDPLGKVGLEILKSLDGEGRVVLSLFARPRAGDPMKFHARMMREAGLRESEIAQNLKVYGTEPVNTHGLFESAGRFLNYAETEVSAGKLHDYAMGIAKLFEEKNGTAPSRQ